MAETATIPSTTLDEIKMKLKAISEADFEEAKKEQAKEHMEHTSFVRFTGAHNAIFWDAAKKQYYRCTDDLDTGKKDKRIYLDDAFAEGQDCFGSQIKLAGENCNDGINKILTKGDFGEWLKDLDGFLHDDFDTTKTALKHMHPSVALQLLRKFGFYKHTKYDEKAGCELKKVECVSHWMKRVATDANNAAAFQNPQAVHLKRYLDLVSQFVNCNPGIMNKNYKGPCDEQAGKFNVPEDAHKYGIRAPSPFEHRNLMQMCTMWKSKPAEVMNYPINAIGVRPAMVGTMYGGHSGMLNAFLMSPFGTPTFTPGLSMYRETKTHGKPMCKAIKFHLENQGYEVVASVYRALKKDLANKNKSLDKADDEQLQKLIGNYKQIQEQVIKTLCYMEEYAKFADNSTGNVSLASMEKIGLRLNKLSGHQNIMEKDIMQLLYKLAAIVEKDNEVNYSQL